MTGWRLAYAYCASTPDRLWQKEIASAHVTIFMKRLIGRCAPRRSKNTALY